MLDPTAGPVPHDSAGAQAGRETLQQFYAVSGVSPLDLSGQQKSAIRTYFDASSFAFNWYIFGHTDLVANIHGEMCSVLDHWGWCKLADGTWTRDPQDTPVAEDYRRLMFQIPREFFKTSVGTKANALHQVTKFPDEPVAIFNERLDNCKKWLKAIREVAENSLLFQVVYEDLLPPGVGPGDNRSMPRSWAWSDEKLQFQRGVVGIPESSITALGVGAATAGGHWPTIIKDDLISEDAERSPTVMQTAKEWFDGSLYLERPALKGRDLINCTCWAFEDLYDYILKNYNYMLYRRSALEDSEGRPDIRGESIFPEKLSTQELLTHYRRNPSRFLCQMMNLPLASGERKFSPKWDRTFDVREEFGETLVRVRDEHYSPDAAEVEGAPQEVPLRHMELAVFLDPATARKSVPQTKALAKNGLVVCGMCPWGRRFFFEAQSFRKTPRAVITTLLDAGQRWQILRLGIEEVNFSELFRYWLQDILDRDTEYRDYQEAGAYVTPLETGGVSKPLRIENMRTPYQSGWYYFNASGAAAALREELSEYPNGMTVDMVDAAAYIEKYLPRPDTPTEMEDRWWARHRQTSQMSGRDPVTGY